MKKTTAHAIESFANEFNMIGKNITIVLRSKENAIENRPNAFFLTRGKKGWTSCKQSAYYFDICTLSSRPATELYIYKLDRNGEILNGRYYEKSGSYHKIDYREYTDAEIIEILNDAKIKGVFSKSQFGSWYEINA